MLSKIWGVIPKGPIALRAIHTSFVLGLRLVIQAGTLLLVARMMGPEQFGLFAGIAALAVLLGTFSTFGTHLVLLGEVSKDKKRREQVLSYAVPTTIISGSFLFLVYLVSFWFWFSDISLPLTAVICIGITEILLLPLYLLPATDHLAQEKTARSQLLIIIPLALRLLVAVGITVVVPEQPLTIFAWLYMATALLALALMRFYSPDAWLTVKKWKLASRNELKHSASYAALALTAAGPSELDKMLAVKLMPLSLGGLYAAASRVVGAATLPVIALLLSALPRLFRDAEDSSVQRNQLADCIFLSVFLYGLVLAGLVSQTTEFVEWLFGENYRGMGEMLSWLCLAIPAMGVRLASGDILIARGKAWVRVAIEFLGILSLLFFAISLTAGNPKIGMPLAFICSEWFLAICGYTAVKVGSRNEIADNN